jgi:2-polyprenyl-3-methyl-5-hydroxy-6-metoxy-1,4-benzoquinol methylase
VATYDEKIQQEAELWGREAERMAQNIAPDWREHQYLLHNRILHGEHINRLLDRIDTGMQTLELGCASGWLTLAMAQRGADATGLDVSEKSLAIARDYYARIADDVPGTAHYRYADLNELKLAPNTYDVVVIKATLHHLVNMDDVIATVHRALKPGGLFWISDTLEDEHISTVLFASGLTFLLPTAISYREKIGGLLKFGLNAPERIKMSMEAEGLSPFEGAGRNHNWLELIEERFSIERVIVPPAVTGYVTAQLKLPDAIGVPLLRGLKVVDKMLVAIGILKPSARIVYARK